MPDDDEIEIKMLESPQDATFSSRYEELQQHILQEIRKSIYGPGAALTIQEP